MKDKNTFFPFADKRSRQEHTKDDIREACLGRIILGASDIARRYPRGDQERVREPRASEDAVP